MKTYRQALAAKEISIKPITEAPISIDFFNGEKYEGSDKIEYPGYTPVVIGTISKDPEDVNYISQETFDALAIDAYYDIDAYVNKAMTVLGMFNKLPNFTAIPVITKDMMMRAIAAKIEQNLFTNPSNAEVRVTLTQSSGGRTTNLPARENFNPSDMLNQKVQEYINGSRIFELVKDNFQALVLERNDYYTKGEIDALLGSESVAINNLFTNDVDTWEPTNPGDGVNKKYVDYGTNQIWEAINKLIVGDVELKTNHISIEKPELETISGVVKEQNEANIEYAAAIKKNIETINEIGLRQGVPFQGFKTLAQTVSTTEQIIDYDEVNKGSYDGLRGFDSVKGEYTIQDKSEGDLVSIETTVEIVGAVRPGIKAGTLYIYKNGAPFVHPVSGIQMKQDFIIDNVKGIIASIRATDIPVRIAGTGNGEVEIGDVFSVWVGSAAGDLLISDVNFDLVNLKQLNVDSIKVKSEDVITENEESISGGSISQKDINIEIKNNITNNLEPKIESNKTDIAANKAAIDAIPTPTKTILCDSLIEQDAQAYITLKDSLKNYDELEIEVLAQTTNMDDGTTWEDNRWKGEYSEIKLRVENIQTNNDRPFKYPLSYSTGLHNKVTTIEFNSEKTVRLGSNLTSGYYVNIKVIGIKYE